MVEEEIDEDRWNQEDMKSKFSLWNFFLQRVRILTWEMIIQQSPGLQSKSAQNIKIQKRTLKVQNKKP